MIVDLKEARGLPEKDSDNVMGGGGIRDRDFGNSGRAMIMLDYEGA